MRLLGLDLGTKTLGIAISDRCNVIANPLKVIRFSEVNEAVLNELLTIIKDNKITTIVLGLPKNMDNSEGFASDRSKQFKKLLEKKTDVKIVFEDERLTTVQAEKILITNNKKRLDRKLLIDATSACLILECYMERIKRNG